MFKILTAHYRMRFRVWRSILYLEFLRWFYAYDEEIVVACDNAINALQLSQIKKDK